LFSLSHDLIFVSWRPFSVISRFIFYHYRLV